MSAQDKIHTDIYSYEHQESVLEKYQVITLIIPFLTIPIYLEAVYCLCSSNFQMHKHYVSVLMLHVALSFIGEFYGFFLVRPVVILPIVGLYSDGLLGSFKIHTFLQVILLFGLYQINACTMIHLLLYRLKNIIPFTYRYHKLVTRFGYFFMTGTYSGSILSLFDFALLYEDQAHAKQFWNEALDGNLPSNFWSDNYVVTSGEFRRFNMFLKLCATSLTLYTLTCAIIPALAFRILNKSGDRLSKRVVNGHKHYLKALLVQVFIIISFLLLPFAFFIVGLKMRLHSPLLVAISITLAISHGAAATLAMLFANKPFRSILLSHVSYGIKIQQKSNPIDETRGMNCKLIMAGCRLHFSFTPNMEMADTDVEEQDRVLNLYLTIMKFIPIITVPIYCEGVYCVLKKSPSFQVHYSIILGAHIFGCFFEEFYGFQLFRPMVFLPVVGIYADGILSLLGVHPFLQLFGMFFCVQLNGGILSHITFYRLKIIIPMSFRYYYLTVKLGIFAIVFVYIGAISSVATILLLSENQIDAKYYLSMTLRPLPKVFWSDKYMVSTNRNPMLTTFLVCGAICVGFYVVLCAFLPSICYVILHRTKNSLSEKVIKAQKAYLRTILLQVLAVFLCVIMPFSVFFMATAFSALASPMLIAASLIFSICHGAASTLIHLLSNKPFRDTLRAQLSWVMCIVTCSRPKRSNMIHTMSSIVG